MSIEGGEQNFENVRTPGVSHEKRDASFRAVISFGIGLAIAAAIIQLVMWAMLRYFDQQRAAGQVAPHAQFAEGPRFTAPPIQADPVHDMNEFRASEQRILTSYTWSDDQHTAVRIPIEKAKEELLAKGLPVAPSGGTAVTAASKPAAPHPPQAATR